MALEQVSYRFRNDDGSETTATWKAAVNTLINLPASPDSDLRVRFLIQATGGAEAPGTIQLEYNHNTGGWTSVTETSTVVRSFDSSNFTDEDATTQQIGAGTFIAGRIDDADGVGGNANGVTLAPNEESEYEFAIRIREADISATDEILLRVTEGGTPFDTYTNTAQIDIEPVGGGGGIETGMFLKKRNIQPMLQNL